MSRFELKDSFFEDEIREGFYIPSAVKKAWGAELRVLNEIDRVCAELGIKYFATWGTFLGAVRHGGYVPWDDDLDICMLRDDYIRFINEGVPMLPKGYEIYDHSNKDDHTNYLANVVAKARICFEEDHLKDFHGYPYIAGIDVFQIDYMSPDEKEHELVRLQAMLLLKLSGDIIRGDAGDEEIKAGLKSIEENVGITVPEGLDKYEIRRFLDIKTVELFSYYVGKKEKAEKIVQMMPCGIWNDEFYILPALYYSDRAEIPFEMGNMPVPLYYEPAVRKHYKNYMKVYRGTAAHSYPCFAKAQEELKTIQGFDMPEYRVNADELKDRRVVCCGDEENKDTYKAVVNECLKELDGLQEALNDASAGTEDIAEICDGLQQLAIDLGTYMETVKGEGYDIVSLLEKYCEALYELSLSDTPDKRLEVNEIYTGLSGKIRARKEILFLPFKGEYWQAFEAEYRRWSADPDADVYIVPIPYYYKDYLGRLYDMQYDPEKYQEELAITHYEAYDYALHHPDIIYIQNPYDQWNEITSVPPFFYSDKLLSFTDRLIYVPWFRTYDFNRDDHPQYYNMKYYCNVPGVINADEVLLQSEMIREAYIEKLCEFAGEESRGIWEKKLKVAESCKQNNSDPDDRKEKTILYYQDFSDILYYGQKAIDKLNTVIDKYRGIEDHTKCVIIKSMLIDELLNKHAPELYNKYTKTLSKAESISSIEIIDEKDADLNELVGSCSGFYGDAGRIAHMFDVAQKPIEIQDYEIDN